jgi:hypothetical protein
MCVLLVQYKVLIKKALCCICVYNFRLLLYQYISRSGSPSPIRRLYMYSKLSHRTELAAIQGSILFQFLKAEALKTYAMHIMYWQSTASVCLPLTSFQSSIMHLSFEQSLKGIYFKQVVQRAGFLAHSSGPLFSISYNLLYRSTSVTEDCMLVSVVSSKLTGLTSGRVCFWHASCAETSGFICNHWKHSISCNNVICCSTTL